MKIDNATGDEMHILHDTLFRRWDFSWLRSRAGEEVAGVMVNLTRRANGLMQTARVEVALKRAANASRVVCYRKKLFDMCDEDMQGAG